MSAEDNGLAVMDTTLEAWALEMGPLTGISRLHAVHAVYAIHAIHVTHAGRS